MTVGTLSERDLGASVTKAARPTKREGTMRTEVVIDRTLELAAIGIAVVAVGLTTMAAIRHWYNRPRRAPQG